MFIILVRQNNFFFEDGKLKFCKISSSWSNMASYWIPFILRDFSNVECFFLTDIIKAFSLNQLSERNAWSQTVTLIFSASVTFTSSLELNQI